MSSKGQRYSVSQYQNVAKSLIERLGLESDIVAFKYIKNISEIPDQFISPMRDLNEKMTICMAAGQTRKEGENISITVDVIPLVRPGRSVRAG
jgi:uncharacterized protein (DUF169 family)